jgi:hypothetical protein
MADEFAPAPESAPEGVPVMSGPDRAAGAPLDKIIIASTA